MWVTIFKLILQAVGLELIKEIAAKAVSWSLKKWKRSSP